MAKGQRQVNERAVGSGELGRKWKKARGELAPPNMTAGYTHMAPCPCSPVARPLGRHVQ